MLAALGLVESYQQFNINGASSGYGLNPALTNPQFQNQPQQHFRPNQGNVMQVNNNAQRFYMPSLQLQNQGFSPLQTPIQHNQQRQIPLDIKTQLQQQQQQPPQQISYLGSPQQQSLPLMRLPILPPPPPPQQSAPISPAQIPMKKNSVALQPPPDRDFLSSLQIIDNHGNLRNLQDFGLGGTNNQPVNPELEKSLRSIFETIHKDLENAEFLPLDMNGAQNQLGDIFQGKPPGQLQNAQNIQQHQTNFGPRKQPQQIEQQGHRQQQVLGYAFQQPKQNQFQYLKPLRANKVNQSPEQPIRSPAQALRNSKQQFNQVKDEQKPIDNLPIKQEKSDSPPTNGGPEVQKQQNDFKEHTQTLEKAPTADTKGRRQPQPFIPQQEEFNQVQEPIVRQPTKIQAPLSEQKSAPVQEQQQANLGFDDEPVELKAVVRAPVQPPKNQLSGKQRLSQGQHGVKTRKELSPVAQTIEQVPLNQEGFEQQPEDERSQTKTQLPQSKRPSQQNQYEEEKSTDSHSIKSKVKKFDGWTPIVQRPQITEKQRVDLQQQQFSDQQRDDLGFDDQRPVFQEKDSGSFDQPKQEPELTKNEFPVQQQEVQVAINQQPPATKGGGGSRLVKLRKSINKFATSAKYKLASSSDTGSTQYPTEQRKIQQNVQQDKVSQQQEQQIFDTLSNPQETNLDQGQQEQLTQEVPQQPRVEQQPIKSQDQAQNQSPPSSPAAFTSTNSFSGPSRVQVPRQPTKSLGRQTVSKVVGPIKTNQQQFEESPSRQPQQLQEEVQSQQQQNFEEPLQQQKQQEIDQPQTQLQQTQITQQQDEFSQGGPQQQPRPDSVFSQQPEEQFSQQKQSQQQQQKLDDEPLQQQRQDDFAPQQKQDESFSQQKQEDSFSQQKQEEVSVPQQKQEEPLAQQKQEEPLPQQKQDEQLFLQKQSDDIPQQRQEEQLSQQKQEEVLPQQKEGAIQEQRVQQEEFTAQVQEQLKPQKQPEQQEQQQVDEPFQQQQQQQSPQLKESEDELLTTTTTTSTTSRPRQVIKSKGKGQLKNEEKSVGRGRTTRPQKQTLSDGVKQIQKTQGGHQISQQQDNEGQSQQQEEVNTQTKIEDELPTTFGTTTTTPRQISKSLGEEQRIVGKGRLPSQKTRQQQETDQVEEKQQSIEQDRQEVQIQQQQQQPQQQKQQIEDDRVQEQGVQQEELGLAQVKTQEEAFSAAAATTTTTTTFRPRLQSTKRLRQEVYQTEKKSPTGQQERGQRAQAQRAQLSAHQLLNTYNPLQFEPERISSFTRASQSSSQNTNVNSPLSAESY